MNIDTNIPDPLNCQNSIYSISLHGMLLRYSKLSKTKIGKLFRNESKPWQTWLFKTTERPFREVFMRLSSQILEFCYF